MNSKMTTDSQLSTEPKKEKQDKNERIKQLEQEQNHRYRDHLDGYQLGRKRGESGKRYRDSKA